MLSGGSHAICSSQMRLYRCLRPWKVDVVEVRLGVVVVMVIRERMVVDL